MSSTDEDRIRRDEREKCALLVDREADRAASDDHDPALESYLRQLAKQIREST